MVRNRRDMIKFDAKRIDVPRAEASVTNAMKSPANATGFTVDADHCTVNYITRAASSSRVAGDESPLPRLAVSSRDLEADKR